jgi:hypothetical protein
MRARNQSSEERNVENLGRMVLYAKMSLFTIAFAALWITTVLTLVPSIAIPPAVFITVIVAAAALSLGAMALDTYHEIKLIKLKELAKSQPLLGEMVANEGPGLTQSSDLLVAARLQAAQEPAALRIGSLSRPQSGEISAVRNNNPGYFARISGFFSSLFNRDRNQNALSTPRVISRSPALRS